MITLGEKTLVKGEPTVAIGFTDNNDVEELKILQQHKKLDIAEIRVDMFENISLSTVENELHKFKSLNIPTILTIRPEYEGGMWKKNEEERVNIFSSCLNNVDAIDIELSALNQDDKGLITSMLEKKLEDTKLIISYHNFSETPGFEKTSKIISDISSKQADLIKVACQLNSMEDLNTLTKILLENTDKNLIIIGMGSYGLLTRLSFPAYGSLLTFAYAHGMPTAPGQIHVDDMVEKLRLMYPAYNQKLINDFELLEAV